MKIHTQLLKVNSLLTITITFILLFCFSTIHAQKVTYPDSWAKQGFNLEKQSKTGVEIFFSIRNFSFKDIDIKGEAMKQIDFPGNFLPNDEGAPDLPGTGRFIAIPQGATASFEIISSRTETFKNVNMSPAPRIPKETETGPLEYNKNQKIYSRNAYYPESPVLLSEPTSIRGVDAVILGITPYQYNPVTKELIVYRDLKVKVNFEGGNGQFGENRLRSRWFDPILSDMLINWKSLPAVQYPQHSPNSRTPDYEYIIITPDDPVFISWADSLKLFRNKQGIRTGIVTITEAGGNNVTAIENFIDNAYNTWDVPPVAVLLLGDYGTSGNTIISPLWNSECVSDNVYADVINNDHMPEVILARMTAQDETHLEIMIGKILKYERTPPTNPDFYDHPITALGWQTSRWFQICAESIGGYFKNIQGKDPVRINEIYSGNPNVDPWSTATNTNLILDYFGPNGLGYIPASPSSLGGWSGGNATMINNAINDGAFILQHRDHGGETGWGEPPYSNSDIDNLVNEDLCFVFSINCLTGKYNWYNECFAEKFHRHEYGALGIIAASEISYSFVNDTYVWGLYDNMWPDFMPDYQTDPEPRGLLPAFGNAGGKYFLEQSSWPYNSGSKAITYNLFHHHGGAFSTLYSEIPQNLTVIHDDVLLAGLDFFTVQADEGSLIALSVDGEIIGTAEGTGSPLDIIIEPQYPPAMVDVVVTKTNYYRYNALIQVIPPTGPYIIKESFTINDTNGNGNGQVDYGEDILLSLTMKNVGSENGENIMVNITTEDDYIEIIVDSADYGTIPSSQSVTVTDGFEFEVAGDIPDNHQIIFDAIATDGVNTWTSTFSMIAYAPNLVYASCTIDDSNGNNNGKLDPGETVDLIIEVANNGSADAYDLLGELITNDPYVTVNSDPQSYGDILSGGSGQQTYNVTALVTTPTGYNTPFEFEITGFAGVTGLGEFFITVGQIPVLILDMDDNMNSGPHMYSAIQDIGVAVEYTTAFPDDVNLYASIFVCLGVYDDNHILTEGEGQILADFVDNGGLLYMEGGDTWYYNTPTAVHSRFNINGLSDGNDDLGTINGLSGTFTEDLSYDYTGDNKWIDRISPLGSAFVIFDNLSPSYNCAIAYDEGTYKTIGASFEFGGLSNGNNTKLELMEKYLDFFGFSGVPDAPPCPEGPGQVCQDANNTQYSTCSVEDADLYFWSVDPPEAGIFYGTDTIVTMDWSTSYIGTALIYVSAMNSSGLGPQSMGLEVNVNELPTATISGNAEICLGDSTQVTVELTGIPPWIIVTQGGTYSYEIFSSPWTLWVKPTETTEYTITSVVDNNNCVNIGDSSAIITVIPYPDSPATPDGPILVDTYITSSTDYTIPSTQNATDHNWTIIPPNAGTLLMENTSCTITWSQTYIGNAELKVQGINDCGTGEYSDALNITVENNSAIAETNAGIGVTIYPNPTDGQFTIELISVRINKVNINVFNALGFAIYEAENVTFDGSYSGTIDLTNHAEGMYFLMIESKEGVFYQKIIINR